MTHLKEFREKQGLSQSQLANAAGVSVRMVQNYEQGTNDINKAQGITLYRIAKALNCTIENLLEM